MSREVLAPILNDLVQKGALLNWGIMEHQWGDEWNWNIYYAAKDIPTFLASFESFIEKAQATDPAFVSELWETCFES